ncbi:hypothetical protein KC19_1G057700 [Ceratodon purpureus]|uniref:Uncharacterized protein n=1 Tax=Ceratodon purpureus TaxID=3225 RepID=A0A8T0J530_CERPU|nr:hypothetical protein KC19_1G057700 [Ceratodon purpureus]
MATMGDRHSMRVQASNATAEFAGVGSRLCNCSSKNCRELVESHHSRHLVDDGAHGCVAARHGTSSCGVCSGSERKELENGRWVPSLQRRDEVVKASFGFVGSSFRSEDSEVLALWEEKSEKSPKAVSTDLSWLKPRLSVDSSHSPWRESVSNAVKKIESLSHVFSRSSPVHPKGDTTFESPRPSLEYLMKHGDRRSSWRDFKFNVTSPARSSTESVLHNSPKARYSNASLCRVMNRIDQVEPALTTAPAAPIKLRHTVSCEPERQFGSSAAARPVDFNHRKPQVDDKWEPSPWKDSYHEKRAQRNENESELSCSSQAPIQPEHLVVIPGKVVKSLEAGPKPTLPPRTYSLNLPKPEDTSNVRRSSATASSERALLRQSAKFSAEVASTSTGRCSSINRTRAQSMDEAMLNEYASEAGAQQARAATLHSQEAAERKPSHRYYQRVTSRERSSRWSSCDDTPLDHIDFVAPSAAKFLDDEACASPVKSPVHAPGAVPFKWEKEPGKPKENSDSTTSAQCRCALQLPPRLALRKQHSSPLRNRYINMSMSAPLAELYPLPSQKSASSVAESMKVQLPWIEGPTSCQKTAGDSCLASNPERGPCRRAAMEPPISKSKSAGDFRSSLQILSHFSPAGDIAGDQGSAAAQKPRCTGNDRQLGFEQKPVHLNSGDVRPTSPTSILCGPGDGSHPSSLSSEQEAPQISVTGAASALSHSRVPSCASFDSMEHSIEHSSELVSPESSLTSPLRANTRCNSMSYNDDIDHIRKYVSKDSQKGASQGENAFVKFCKTGKRWMKTKTHSKLGTIYSPEVWTPGVAVQFQRGVNSDFSDRLDGMSTSKIDHSHMQIESRFRPSASPFPHEDVVGDRSPAYAATLELLSPARSLPSKKTLKNRHVKPPPRLTRKTTSRLRVRARLRARFLVPMRRALRTLLSRCTFRRRNKNAKAAESSKPLYHVDYTLTRAEF